LFFFIVLLYIFQAKPQESTSENIDWIVERLLNLTGGKISRFIIKNFASSFLLFLDNFTRTNILGQLTFDQVETMSTSSSSSSPVSKLLLTHGPDGSIDHDSTVNTVCF
jgi:hypothetical protein